MVHEHHADNRSIDERLDVLAEQRFRSRFHLRGRDRTLVQVRGTRAIPRHGEDLIA